MAGYLLYSLDTDVFTQLTTSPTREQGLILADHHCQHEGRSSLWPADREALADVIVKRLAQPDWYSDLSFEDADMWDNVLNSL